MLWEKVHVNVAEAEHEGDEDVGPDSGVVKRWGHSFNAVRGGRLLYTFGGYDNDSNPTNKVLVFDIAAHIWSEPVIRGVPPVPRDRHSGTVVEDKIFVFGGVDDEMQLFNDLHVLDTSSNTWISPRVKGEIPRARKGHGAAIIGKSLFVFGGCVRVSSFMSEVYYNDLFILNTETFEWRKAVTSGTPPSRRENHTCSSWKNKFIVIGGIDMDNNYLADVHVLDADTLVWRKLNTRGQLLPPRAGHTTVSLGRSLFVFGGFFGEQITYDDFHRLELDVDVGVWTKLMVVGEGPSPRFFMAGDSLDLQMDGVLIFFGGCNQHFDPTDDVYYLHTGLIMENGRDEHLEKPSSRKEKLKCKEQGLRMKDDRDERWLEKFSSRKKENVKFLEQYMFPSLVNDKASIKIEQNADGFKSIPILSSKSTKQKTNLREYYSFPGKRIIQAMVVKSVPVGYTIDTGIDGKFHCGVLFSNKSSSNGIDYNSRRKRGAVNIGGQQLYGIQLRTSKAHITEPNG